MDNARKQLSMHDWFKKPIGRYIAQWETQYMQQLTADIFGYHAVQIGFAEIDALKENRITHHWLTEPYVDEVSFSDMILRHATVDKTASVQQNVLIHTLENLPFETESIDLVVLPHAFDFAQSPHHLIREIHRILIPEGKVIISGFNPTSLWGIRQKFARLSGSYFLPENAEFIGLSRIKDWLKLLGFEIQRGYIGCYCPPCQRPSMMKRFAFMEKAGNRWWPYCGAVYLVCACKHTLGMTLIGPAFERNTKQFLDVASTVNTKADHELEPTQKTL